MYAGQFQGLLRTESQGLPSRHTIGTSSPCTQHTAVKKVKERHQKAEDTVVVLPAASLNNINYIHRGIGMTMIDGYVIICQQSPRTVSGR